MKFDIQEVWRVGLKMLIGRKIVWISDDNLFS